MIVFRFINIYLRDKAKQPKEI